MRNITLIGIDIGKHTFHVYFVRINQAKRCCTKTIE